MQWLARAESRQGIGIETAASGTSRSLGGGNVGLHHRYSALVSRPPANDDETIIGAAWPLVKEWRDPWDGHLAEDRGWRGCPSGRVFLSSRSRCLKGAGSPCYRRPSRSGT